MSRIRRVWAAEGGLWRAAEGCRGRAVEAGFGAAEGGRVRVAEGGRRWADRSAVMGHLSPSHTCNTRIMCLSHHIQYNLNESLSVARDTFHTLKHSKC
jgi:hypothetical protein